MHMKGLLKLGSAGYSFNQIFVKYEIDAVKS